MKKQDGQSTIEFILTFMFSLGIVFLFVNVAVNYSVGYVVHYATFMASRTYLTVDSGINNLASSEAPAQAAALSTFLRFKMQSLGVPAGGVLPAGDSAPGLHINNFSEVNDSAEALFVGAYAVFERPLSFFRSVGGTTKSKFVSESFLGKEPVRADCYERTCAAIMLGIGGAGSGCTGGGTVDFTVFDNGC